MYSKDYLAHYGVLGMKWGRRRLSQYENASEKIRSGKAHLSRGLGKRRQGAYDILDAKRFEAKAEIVKSEMARTEKKDMSKLQKASSKAAAAARKAADFRSRNTFATSDLGPDIKSVYVDNPRLIAKARRAENKVNRLITSLNKKHNGTVSASFKEDVQTGKRYVDLMLGSQTERVDIN